MTNYRERNRAAWNRLVKQGSRFAHVATDKECRSPLQTLDSREWLPASVHGKKVLCLASGGGWQSILYASAGADVTVVDISSEMLKLDEQQARQRGLDVRTIEASMDDLSVLRAKEFDIVHQPVSTCYVPDIGRTYAEVARVLRVGGLYISQHKQPTSLQVTHRNRRNQFVIGIEYYRDGPLPDVEDTSYREPHAKEFLHRIEQLIGDLCRCGFVVEDVREPIRADIKAAVNHFGYRGRFVSPYIRIKARRVERTEEPISNIWTP